ncbi:MAG: hypothetical protein AB8G05_26575 [Oligoflexales bacterium]
MLRTRRYQEIAIDLWQGSLYDFASDVLVICQYDPGEEASFCKTAEGVSTYPAPQSYILRYPNWDELHKLWTFHLNNNPVKKRHLAIAFTCTDESAYSANQVKDLFLGLKKFLDSPPGELKRISLVFERLAVHDIFQEELFAIFPYQE